MAVFSRDIVEGIKEGSRNVFPNEFIALLRKDKNGVVSELLIFPRTTYGRGFSSLDMGMVPLLSNHCGSVHSHPTPSNRPSKRDLLFFQRLGGIHMIISHPFEDDDIAVYDAQGKRLLLEIK
jgi:proteasome lid subunit RPN8/RPN11